MAIPSAARWGAVLALLALSSLTCNLSPPAIPAETPQGSPGASTPTPRPTLAATSDYDAARIENILAGMTPEDKVGQMFMLGYFDASELLDIYQMVERGRPGGIVLFGHNVGSPTATATMINRLQSSALETAGVPLLVAADQEGGIVLRLRRGFTAWPNVMALAATRDPDLATRVGEGIASEMAAVGFNMDLAPVTDVLSNPSNTVIGVRSFGSVPSIVSTFSTAMLHGLHAGGVIATAKHFPGHGGTNDDSHLVLPTDDRDRSELEADLLPFQTVIDAGVDAVMTAHMVYPALSGDGQAATFSYAIVTGLLREEMGFQGVILSDAMSMGAVLEQFPLEVAVERAIVAGVDMLTFGRGVSPEDQLAAISHVVRLVQLGILDEARIDESVRRILVLKSRYGLLDWLPVDVDALELDLEAHQALAYEVAAYAVTQLHDQAHLLPLDADSPVMVVYPTTASATGAAFRTYDPDVNLIGYSSDVSQDDWDRVLTAAAEAGTIVILTQDAITNENQAGLVRALPAARTVAVAIRSPYDILAYPDVQTYVLTYSGSDAALSTLARMLYGHVGALGRLPIDLP